MILHCSSYAVPCLISLQPTTLYNSFSISLLLYFWPGSFKCLQTLYLLLLLFSSCFYSILHKEHDLSFTILQHFLTVYTIKIKILSIISRLLLICVLSYSSHHNPIGFNTEILSHPFCHFFFVISRSFACVDLSA